MIDTVLWAIPVCHRRRAGLLCALSTSTCSAGSDGCNRLGGDLPHLGRRACHLRRRHCGLFDGVSRLAAAKSISASGRLTDCCVAGPFHRAGHRPLGQLYEPRGLRRRRRSFPGACGSGSVGTRRIWTYILRFFMRACGMSIGSAAALFCCVPAPAASTGRTPAFTSSGMVIGRFWIEGLRTDSLYLFHWHAVRSSASACRRRCALVMIVLTAVILLKNRSADPARMFVNRRLDGQATVLPDRSEERPIEDGAREAAARRRRPRRTPPVGKRPRRAPQSRRTAETTAESLLNKRRAASAVTSVLLCCFMVCSARRRAFWPSSAPGGASGRR